jgi:SOS response regulatory protein OraA/RecX
MQKRLPQAVVEQALLTVEVDTWQAGLQNLIAKQLRLKDEPWENLKKSPKLYAHLQRQGFDPSQIRQAIQDFSDFQRSAEDMQIP